MPDEDIPITGERLVRCPQTKQYLPLAHEYGTNCFHHFAAFRMTVYGGFEVVRFLVKHLKLQMVILYSTSLYSSTSCRVLDR